MKRLLPLALVLLLPAQAAADGCPPSTCGTTSSALPGSRTLIVRPNGSFGPLIAYDLVARRQRFQLPPGLLSADRGSFVSATRRPRATVTRFTVYDAANGRALARWTLAGRHAVVGISRDGSRFVTLEARHPARGKTHFVVLDGRGKQLARVSLRGTFEVEALSPDGDRIFLVHWHRNGYELQQYDLRSRRLRPTPTLEPDGAEEEMTGSPSTAVASRDGRWLLTLYLEPEERTGFIHAFDLRKGLGHCIDLPVRAGPTALGTTALALSPDERMLYVASPLLGRVITVDLRRLRVTRKASFRAVSARTYAFGIGPSAAISRDGRTLAFSSHKDVWRYHARRGFVVGKATPGRFVNGVAFTPAGELAVLRTSGRFVVLRSR